MQRILGRCSEAAHLTRQGAHEISEAMQGGLGWMQGVPHLTRQGAHEMRSGHAGRSGVEAGGAPPDQAGRI